MTEEEIKHLAKLSELQLSDDEVEEMKNNFDELLNFVWKLQSINTEWVEKMYTPVDSNKLDYTRNTNTEVNKEQLLKNSPQEIENNMIVVKSSTVEH
jgi:aspartyl-tRNA(Asn)/glutamyl-tRNA(Gln) amidotransferase subunit C